MTEMTTRDFGKILLQKPDVLPWSRTSWGEQARVLVSPLHSGQPFCIMDYAAPANFGPPRHIHFRDDEILRLISGSIVVWSPQSCCVAVPGHVVVLPKGVPHTWRSLDESVRMEVTTAPGDLEVFFQRLQDCRATLEQTELLNEVSEAIGVSNIGPRLSQQDTELILKGAEPS